MSVCCVCVCACVHVSLFALRVSCHNEDISSLAGPCCMPVAGILTNMFLHMDKHNYTHARELQTIDALTEDIFYIVS